MQKQSKLIQFTKFSKYFEVDSQTTQLSIIIIEFFFRFLPAWNNNELA